MRAPSEKAAAERALRAARRALTARAGGVGAARRDLRRFVPRAVRSVNPIARMITETREVFEVDGYLMQVERRIPSGKGPHRDVILVRSYGRPTWKPNPFRHAIQVHTLELMIEQDKVSFPMGLGRAASDFVSGWSAANLALLAAHVERGRA